MAEETAQVINSKHLLAALLTCAGELTEPERQIHININNRSGQEQVIFITSDDSNPGNILGQTQRPTKQVLGALSLAASLYQISH